MPRPHQRTQLLSRSSQLYPGELSPLGLLDLYVWTARCCYKLQGAVASLLVFPKPCQGLVHSPFIQLSSNYSLGLCHISTWPARTLPGKGGEATPLPHLMMPLWLSCLCVLIYFSEKNCACYSISLLSHRVVMTGSNSENWIPLWEEWEDEAALFHVRFFRRQVLGSALCSTVGRSPHCCSGRSVFCCHAENSSSFIYNCLKS